MDTLNLSLKYVDKSSFFTFKISGGRGGEHEMFEKGDGPVRAAEREGDRDGRPPAPPRHGHRLCHRRHTLPLGTGWFDAELYSE